MILIAAFFHDDVGNATQGAAMFGLYAPSLNLHFLNKIKRYIRVRVTADEICRILTFDKVPVFRVRSAADLVPGRPAVRTTCRRAAARPRSSDAHSALQGLVPGRGSKLNDRLEGFAMRDELDHVFSNICHSARGSHIDLRRRTGHLDDFRGGSDVEREVDRRKMANFENQTVTFEGSKALRRHRNGVRSRWKIGEAIVAASICLDFLAAH